MSLVHFHSDKHLREAVAELAKRGIVGVFHAHNGSGEAPVLIAHDARDHRSVIADLVGDSKIVLLPDVRNSAPLSAKHLALLKKHHPSIASGDTFADALRKIGRPGPFNPDNF